MNYLIFVMKSILSYNFILIIFNYVSNLINLTFKYIFNGKYFVFNFNKYANITLNVSITLRKHYVYDLFNFFTNFTFFINLFKIYYVKVF